MYDSVEEVRQKLEGSVVLYDNHPIKIMGAGGRKGSFNLNVLFLPDYQGTAKEVISLDDPKFDCWSIGGRLGYVNYTQDLYKQATYVKRIAVRNTHGTQGLTDRNVIIDRLKPYRRKRLGGLEIPFWDRMAACPGFVKTMKRVYPSFNRAVKALEDDDDIFSIAFNPHFAVRRTQYQDMFLLDYKGTEIGISNDLEKFRIQPEFKYLKDSLVELNLKVA